MKTISEALAATLAAPVAKLATLWKLTRADGAVMGFTDHDANLTYDGLTYRAATGFTPSTIADSASLAVDNLEIASVLNSEEITEADLMAGLYDGATVEVLQVDYGNLAAGAMLLRRGTLGEVKLTDQGFVVELRGMMQAFETNLCELYSATCRATFGDARCGLNLPSYTATGVVSAVTDRRSFTDAARPEPPGFFDGGLLTWTSGDNAGRKMEVKGFAFGQFGLYLPMASDIAVGDTYTVSSGCDKTFTMCRDRYGNQVNFRGEPHVPGNDFLTAPIQA